MHNSLYFHRIGFYIEPYYSALIISMSFKNEYMASALVIALLATIALIPLKSADAQVLPRTTVGEVLSDSAKQKIADLKTNHPELGALADKLQTMNVTQVTNEIAALLDFGQTMVVAVKNLQGNMTARQ